MSRYIILIEWGEEIMPIVAHSEDVPVIAVYKTLPEAKRVAEGNIACRAHTYQIIDLDNTDDES